MILDIDSETLGGRRAWSLRMAMTELGRFNDDALPMLFGSWLHAAAWAEIARREALDS